MSRRARGFLLLPLAVLLTALAIQAVRASVAPPPTADVRPAAVLLFSGLTEGYIDECGCPKNPMGGLARRAGHVTSIRKLWPGIQPLWMDTGDFADTPGPFGDAKTLGLVEGMNRLSYAAVAVGERELMAGAEMLRQIRQRGKFQFLAANLQSADQQIWPRASLSLTSGDLRIGVTAVLAHNPLLDAKSDSGAPLTTIPPAVALRALIPKMRLESDFVVLLTSLPIEDSIALAREVRGIDLIVGAHGSRVTEEPLLEGETRIIYLGDQAKVLAQVELYRQPSKALLSQSRVIGLVKSLPSDPDMESYVFEVLQKAQSLGTPPSATGSDEGIAKFLGIGACAACHAPIVAQWNKAPHSHAYEILKAATEGKAKANCLPCHTTGMGLPTGFVDEISSPHLLNVGCESCHGPAEKHVADSSLPYGKTSLATCTRCHDAQNDPQFNYYEARQKVLHPGSGAR